MKRLTCLKSFACLLLIGTGAFLTGCTSDTPAYTAKERFAQINRNILYQNETGNDDFDNVLLLRPGTSLTIWNVYHRD
jgi:hypothetical protein